MIFSPRSLLRVQVVIKYDTQDRRDQVRRTFRFVIWGCLSGVLGHYYITLINSWIPGTTAGDVVLKVIIDQVRFRGSYKM